MFGASCTLYIGTVYGLLLCMRSPFAVTFNSMHRSQGHLVQALAQQLSLDRRVVHAEKCSISFTASQHWLCRWIVLPPGPPPSRRQSAPPLPLVAIKTAGVLDKSLSVRF